MKDEKLIVLGDEKGEGDGLDLLRFFDEMLQLTVFRPLFSSQR